MGEVGKIPVMGSYVNCQGCVCATVGQRPEVTSCANAQACIWPSRNVHSFHDLANYGGCAAGV